MPISIKCDHPMPEEGNCYCKAYEVNVIRSSHDFEDKLHIKFYTEEGISVVKELSSLVLNEETELGKIVMAVNDKKIPYKIDDLEEFIIGNEVIAEIYHETNNGVTDIKVGKVYHMLDFDPVNTNFAEKEECNRKVDPLFDELIENIDVNLSENECEESYIENEVKFNLIDYSEIDNSNSIIGTQKRRRRRAL